MDEGSAKRRVDLDALRALAGATELTTELDVLAERVRNRRFHFAVLGQFKRGKSTLVNVLVGRDVLPVGVVPVTSVVTMVRSGPIGARVRFGDRGWEPLPLERIAELVSDERNRENQRGVSAVEVSLPSGILEHGMCLVDTRGIGSVFRGNTEETRAFVPHIDAAARRAATRDAIEFVHKLLETNSSRVIGDQRDRLVESRRRLEFQVRGAYVRSCRRPSVRSRERSMRNAKASREQRRSSRASTSSKNRCLPT